MKKVMMLIILLATIQSVTAIGIGVSPSDTIIESALKGITYERSLAVYNMGEKDTNYSLYASGDIEGWVNFCDINNPDSNISSVKVPANSDVSVIVKFQIPSDAASKNYTGSLDVKSIPAKTEVSGSQQAVAVGASSKVTIIVTGDQIIDGIVKGISIYDTEPGYPVRISILFHNTGNVVINPEIKTTILQDGNTIDDFVYDETKVKPAILETILAERNTTDKNIPGNYTANVIVSLNGKEIKSDNLPFKIFPVGTLTRHGNLSNVIIEGKPAVNVVSKVHALFVNIGEIDTTAKFKGEVYKDDSLVDMIESDELTVPKGNDIELISYVKPSSNGNYILKGLVVYGGKKTPIKEVPFKVGNNSISGFEGLFVMIVIMILSYIKKRER